MKFRPHGEGEDQTEGGTLLAKPTRNAGRETARSATARWLVWSRGVRPDRIGSSLYGEPAWELMLHLYIEHKEGRRTSAAIARKAIRISWATTFRLVDSLCHAGLAERKADLLDKRRDWLSLSTKAVRQFDSYIDALAPMISPHALSALLPLIEEEKLVAAPTSRRATRSAA